PTPTLFPYTTLFRSEFTSLWIGTVFRQETDAIALDAEVGAEAAAAIHHGPRLVVQVWRTRMLDRRCTVAGPRQSIVIAVARATFRPQRFHVERVLVLHVELQALRR